MSKRIFFYFFFLGSVCALVILLLSCQKDSSKAQTRKFVSQYSTIQEHYARELNLAKTEDEQSSLIKKKIKDLEELLEKYKKIIPIDTKMAKVQLLVAKGETVNALQLLNEIEPLLLKRSKIYRLTAWFYFSMYSEDVKVVKTYAKKFLDIPDLPEKFLTYKGQIYRKLAALAKDVNNLSEARELLEKAISIAPAGKMKMAMESELAHMDSLGKPALPISADTWINSPSPSFSLGQLQGNVVVIVFWAPWCSACGQMIPLLANEYNTHKEKGLMVIGCTKLYGKYSDKSGSESRESVDKEEEIALIKEYIQRNRVTYPNAVSYEGNCYEEYKITGMPTMIFIDRSGKINDVKTGGDFPHLVRGKIKKLLEEINGKDNSR
jgi:cytochrome c biogenesis protein CcmG/thiol:disulfide interchange protein DsbE